MILFKAQAIVAQSVMPFAGAADSVPKLNVEQVCEGIAKQANKGNIVPCT
jgi:hypothetical protein